jgi:uncharacterized protein YrrD
MTTLELLRQSDLINQLVLDRATMAELGRIELLWMYPQTHCVLGFICKSGLLGQQKTAFKLDQLDAIGASGVLTQGSPEKTTVDRVRRLESLLDHEIWSENGNRIGRITDCLFDLRSGAITHYLFAESEWASLSGTIYQLSPAQILSFGKQRVLVLASTRFELYQAGLSQKLSQRAEETAEQAKEQIQELTDQARLRAQRLSRRFSQRAQVWKEQMTEKTQVILEQAKEKSQIIGEQVEAKLETFATQAESAFDTVTDEFTQRRDQVLERTTSSQKPSQNPFDSNFDPDFDPDFDSNFDIDSEPTPAAKSPQPTAQPPDRIKPNPEVPNPGVKSEPVLEARPEFPPLEPPAAPAAISTPLEAPLEMPSEAPEAFLEEDEWDDDIWGDSEDTLEAVPKPAPRPVDDDIPWI